MDREVIIKLRRSRWESLGNDHLYAENLRDRYTWKLEIGLKNRERTWRVTFVSCHLKCWFRGFESLNLPLYYVYIESG